MVLYEHNDSQENEAVANENSKENGYWKLTEVVLIVLLEKGSEVGDEQVIGNTVGECEGEEQHDGIADKRVFIEGRELELIEESGDVDLENEDEEREDITFEVLSSVKDKAWGIGCHWDELNKLVSHCIEASNSLQMNQQPNHLSHLYVDQ